MTAVESSEKKRFTKLVEYYVKRDTCSYMDALVQIAQDKGMDFQDMAKFISPIIKQKIEAEAVERLMLKGGNKLPL